MADDHFLKMALKKLYDWIIELDKYVEEFTDIIINMNELYDIKLLRDVSEHEIEYYKNNGNKQKLFFDEKYNQSIIRPLIINDEYYIGGKINIKDLKIIITKIKIILNKNRFTFKKKGIDYLDKLMKEPKI